jgi:hypothetical protein
VIREKTFAFTWVDLETRPFMGKLPEVNILYRKLLKKPKNFQNL